MYVLYCMFVTAATFHLERSPLNTEAEENAEGVNTVVGVKHKKKQRKKKKKNVLEGDTNE